jgi:hypothetical protein
MRDLNLIDVNEQSIPEQWLSGYRAQHHKSFEDKFSNRSPEQLAKDLINAFDKAADQYDRIAKLQKEKNLLFAQVQGTKKDLRSATLKIWLMGLLVSPVVSELVKKVLHWIFR